MGRQAHLRHNETLIKTARWDDPRGPDDGFRLLVTRYRPRALPKDDETWDAWWKELGPSVELHAAAYGKGQPAIGFDQYSRRYLDEMQAPVATQKIAWLAKSVARGEALTLLCSSACTDEARCHRSLLKRLLLEEIAKLGG
ncbi:MAG: hypothetical protein JWN44_774 [Myxococcales bacterium]|nr:hypothetical protein [Myxococcales bacterium]